MALFSSAEAQRAPVLRQVKTPHAYYFREMLIPQVTTGPTAPTWSPNGQELIYSMAGSLWRQRPDEQEAHQLTDGPGYDYQPDWSPDGRRVVYASYRSDAIELRLLDLASGETVRWWRTAPSTSNPGGLPMAAGSPSRPPCTRGCGMCSSMPVGPQGASGDPTRLTPERDSGLPRYYYHRKDQYFSPTWSPDSRELILMSNRGRIGGSGGFWRVEAQPNGRAREIHYEETTWKAGPDWNGEATAWSTRPISAGSGNNSARHDLRGGDPLQLTYGEFDATTPRWSPAGDRIAYVSNEGGNTSLWVIGLPGGSRKEIRIERHGRWPTGTLRIAVAGSGGSALPARISVRGEDAGATHRRCMATCGRRLRSRRAPVRVRLLPHVRIFDAPASSRALQR